MRVFRPNMAERISWKVNVMQQVQMFSCPNVQLSGKEWTRKYQGRKHRPSVNDNKCPASRSNNTLKMSFPMDNSANALFFSQFQPANRSDHNKTLQNHPSSASTTPDSALSYASIACMPPVCPIMPWVPPCSCTSPLLTHLSGGMFPNANFQ